MKHTLTQNTLDKKIINYALNLSRKNIGITGPNPSVGAVIAKNNVIISTGITAITGTPHAEINAINKIKDKSLLKDCDIYVTLEPCSHYGKNPPCVDAIIEHKFRRVIIATTDPNPLVNTSGIQKLISANINVEVGILENKALTINKRFFKAIQEKMPYITLKLATSLDGKIGCANGSSKWITNSQSRQYAHYLRSQNDTILIGSNTLKKDNPTLNCRLEGLENFSPRPIILSNNTKISPSANISQSQPIIISTQHKTLRTNLKELCEQDINSILIEGGSKVAASFLKEGLVDEIVLFRSNKIIGGDGISMFDDFGYEDIADAIDSFKRVSVKQFDEDLVEHLRFC